MFFKKLKLFTAVFAVLVLISQSVAAVQVSCSMIDSDNPQESMQMTAMDHSTHAMHNIPDSNSNEMMVNCCGDELCSMSNCSWIPISIAVTTAIATPPYSSVLNSHYSFPLHSTDSISPFRPPISA